MTKKLLIAISVLIGIVAVFYLWGGRLPQKSPTELETRVLRLKNNQQDIIKYLNEVLPSQVMNTINSEINKRK